MNNIFFAGRYEKLVKDFHPTLILNISSKKTPNRITQIINSTDLKIFILKSIKILGRRIF